MDNLVMITAGDAIDSTFGVTLGISTLTAAGFGQCCSDVAGITCGGIVDATVAKMNLPVHRLSQMQLDMKITRMWSTFGACVGVLTGCLLGMSVLVFMDTDKVDRERRAKELQSIFESVMNEGHLLLNCKRATLFMLDSEKQELWSRVATGLTKEEGGIIKTPVNTGLVGACVTSGKVINVANAYYDPRFNPEIDKQTGYETKSVLCMPVKEDDGVIIGAIQMINKESEGGKKDEEEDNATFTENDEKMLTMLASHVTAFIRIVDSAED